MSAPSLPLDRNGLAMLDRHQSLALLATARIGRVGLSIDALPVILPVNFALHGDEVVIRTAPGTKLAVAARSAVVAFEADHVDTMSHEGWSVLVTGRARQVTDPDLARDLARLPLQPWVTGEADHWIVITADRVTGRRLLAGRRNPPLP